MATTIERQEQAIPVKKTYAPDPVQRLLLWIGLGVVGIAIAVLTVINFLPLLTGASLPTPESHKVKFFPYDEAWAQWRAESVQQGARHKPFESAAQEIVRSIAGRERIQGMRPVAVVLDWMLGTEPRAAAVKKSQWNDVPFILCENLELRQLIFGMQSDGSVRDFTEETGDEEEDPVTYEDLHGRWVTPNQARDFEKRWTRLKKIKMERFDELKSHLGREASEFLFRLHVYESLRSLPDMDRKEADDPLAFAMLDVVPGSPWFSIAQMRLIRDDPGAWNDLMKQRVREAPQLYLTEQHQQALADFQAQVQAGAGLQAVNALEDGLRKNRRQLVAEYLMLRKQGERVVAVELAARALINWREEFGSDEDTKRLETHMRRMTDGKAPIPQRQDLTVDDVIPNVARDLDSQKAVLLLRLGQTEPAKVADALATCLSERDESRLKGLRKRLPHRATDYVPEQPKFRMLHLTYLEVRFPHLYTEAMRGQKAPLDDINFLLASYDALGVAYRSGDADKFTAASEDFFQKIEQVFEKTSARAGHEDIVYPGEDTINTRVGHLLTGTSVGAPSQQLLDLELIFNRVRPFMWAWILMLGALVLFSLSLALNVRLCYYLGFAFCGLSLVFQLFGFFTRVIVSGRPPVTNMYETVIWVSFMSTIFALILELIYRRKVVAVAGALVATLGLVLADATPLALDPKISPLTPVLRSNFWLTIHVLTIVSSYAGATLAWGVGNISLILIVFGWSKRETIKMLSTFTYRAMQIAVLLLAAGTFLGGWWAAFSWGRFWGWDPKETGALIALLIYVIPLHMRFIGWIKDLGMAVAAVLCYAAILMAWYGINFIIPAGLHAYGFGAGGETWVYWAALLNVEWVLAATLIYRYKRAASAMPS